MEMDHEYCAMNNSERMSLRGEHNYCQNVSQPTSLHVIKGNEAAQQMISNAFDFFRLKFPQFNTTEMTAECLRVSSSTVDRYKAGPTEISVKPPARKKAKILTELPDNTVTEIRHVVYDSMTRVQLIRLPTFNWRRKSWQDADIRSVKSERRWSKTHCTTCGKEKGFVKGASLIFKSGSNKGDYHGEMNSENFEQWLTTALLPSLEEPSVIIMDNASYHSRQLNKLPTKSLRKEIMQNFLRQKNIYFPESATKEILWKLISQQLLPNKSFITDCLIESTGHEVLRLPPYHCQFCAIEMVWSQAKRFYDKNVLKNKDVLDTWKQAINSILESQWTNYVQHTDRTIKAAWERDKLLSPGGQPIIINLQDEDNDDFFEEVDSD